jgi:RND superfamily putative drug exporter
MIAILFGLSMDYQVFLTSRMHEEWTRTGDNDRAVTAGLADTGRVITAAAAIMTLVFSSFALTGIRVAALFGIGLAAAVLIDAFALRTVLVPAAMHLLGAANWWLPRGLDRILPHLRVEPADHPPPGPAARREAVPETVPRPRLHPSPANRPAGLCRTRAAGRREARDPAVRSGRPPLR